MMKKKITNRIEAYLDGSLSPHEAAHFEQELNEDVELRAAFSQHPFVKAGIKVAARYRFGK